MKCSPYAATEGNMYQDHTILTSLISDETKSSPLL